MQYKPTSLMPVIKTHNSSGTLVVTISRPDALNALNGATMDGLREIIQETYQNDTYRGIILTGDGEKAFVAGADIKEFTSLTKEQAFELAQKGQNLFKLIEDCPKPVIAAVNGFALGGGCELAMACHMRIATENAKFGQPEVNLGLIAGYGGTQRLIQYLGKTKAMELHMTADMLNAEQALQLGLLNYVVPQDQLMSKCTEVLEKIKTKSPKAITGVINCVNAYYENGV